MLFFPKSIARRIRRTWKQYTTPTRILLETSKELGFSMPCIRKSLISLNNINLRNAIRAYNKTVPEADRISLSAMSRAIQKGRNDIAPKVSIALRLLSAELDLPDEELFPLDEAA